jgi:hypothetical protein
VIRRGAAISAVKATAKFGQDDLKYTGGEFDKNVSVAIVVCLTVRLRKFDTASHAAFWAYETFSPPIAPGHPTNMRRRPSFFQPGSLPQSN